MEHVGAPPRTQMAVYQRERPPEARLAIEWLVWRGKRGSVLRTSAWQATGRHLSFVLEIMATLPRLP